MAIYLTGYSSAIGCLVRFIRPGLRLLWSGCEASGITLHRNHHTDFREPQDAEWMG